MCDTIEAKVYAGTHRGGDMVYDDNNVFAKIIRGELPCKKVFENDHALAFHDINPLMPVHVLVIPKGPYLTLDDMVAKAGPAALADFLTAVSEAAKLSGVTENGYRMIANNGADANQEVPHFHMHIFGGRKIRGRMIRADSA